MSPADVVDHVLAVLTSNYAAGRQGPFVVSLTLRDRILSIDGVAGIQ